MTTRDTHFVFDYRALRLLVGLIALALPFVVSAIASKELTSISASYYTEARDVFVGMLFIVGAFLWAYNGHSTRESNASKAASLAVVFVALFPTACDGCETSLPSVVHTVAAFILFSILAYFCLGPFRRRTQGSSEKKQRRRVIYSVCGFTIIACMAGAGIAYFALPGDAAKSWQIIYWAEAISLVAFGVAWFVSGNWLPQLADEDEAFRIFESDKKPS